MKHSVVERSAWKIIMFDCTSYWYQLVQTKSKTGKTDAVQIQSKRSEALIKKARRNTWYCITTHWIRTTQLDWLSSLTQLIYLPIYLVCVFNSNCAMAPITVTIDKGKGSKLGASFDIDVRSFSGVTHESPSFIIKVTQISEFFFNQISTNESIDPFIPFTSIFLIERLCNYISYSKGRLVSWNRTFRGSRNY